jgi:hypothetical protein
MGDKSPKATHKQQVQKDAKASMKGKKGGSATGEGTPPPMPDNQPKPKK